MESATIFEVTLVKALGKLLPEGFRHAWGRSSNLRVGSTMFAYRWEYKGEVLYRCYSSHKGCFNVTEACAKEYLRATRTPDGKLKPLSPEQQQEYEQRVRDIEWEVNR